MGGKQKHKKKTRHRSSQSSDSSGNEYEWKQEGDVRDSAKQPLPDQKDSSCYWTSGIDSFEGLFDHVTSNLPSKRQKIQKIAEKAISSSTELNPYWADGGTGLPQSISSDTTPVQCSKLTKENESWLYKSFIRCKEQSLAHGLDLPELLLQRWDEATVADMLRVFGDRSRSDASQQRSRSSPLGATHSQEQSCRWRKPIASTGCSKPSSTSDYSLSTEATLQSRPNSCSSSSPAPTSNPFGQNTETTQTEVRTVTDDDINQMAAKVLRAELSGDQSKLRKLQTNLEKLREASRRGLKIRMHVTKRVAAEQSLAIPLMRPGDKGSDVPVHIIQNRSSQDSNQSYRSQRLKTHDGEGHRLAYLPGDLQKSSMSDLLREERLRSGADMDTEFSRLASKAGRNADDEYDDAFVPRRTNAARDAQRLKQDAVSAYKRRAFAESSCTVCLERISKHLILSLGNKVFLSLPDHVSLVPGHCFLTPYEHVGSVTRMDETALEELIAFKQQLTRMLAERVGDQSCVFMETVLNAESARSHTRIECVPVPTGMLQSIPAYFKKALNEFGSEWDQNRRLISLKSTGFGAYGAVPPKFSYFAVEFGLSDGGLARVIDADQKLPSYFGREVLGGLLDKEHHLWRKPKQESFERLRRKVVEFERWWSSFDKWTSDQSITEAVSSSAAQHSPSISNEPEGPELPPVLNS